MRRATAVALALVALTSCSSSGTGSVASSSARAASTAASTTSSSSAATTTSSAGPCSSPAKPSTAVRVTEGTGDVDGDGQKDAITVYAEGSDAAPGPWHVLVTLAGGRGRLDALVTDAVQGDPSQRIGVLGASPILGGPAEQLFIAVGSGSSATIVGIFAPAACSLARLSLAGSTAPAELAVGGTVTHLDGLRCRGGQLERLSALSADGVTYETQLQRLTIRDLELQRIGGPETGALAADDPALQDFATITCPGVTAP